MIYSQYPREAYTWTSSTGAVYGIGKILDASSQTAWNLACLLVDMERYGRQTSHMDFDPARVGHAVATDAKYWRSLGELTPLAFLYQFLPTEAAGVFEPADLEHAFDQAEQLEAGFHLPVDTPAAPRQPGLWLPPCRPLHCPRRPASGCTRPTPRLLHPKPESNWK